MIAPQQFVDPEHMIRFYTVLGSLDASWAEHPNRVAALYLLTGKEDLWRDARRGFTRDGYDWLEVLDHVTEPNATLLLIAANFYKDDHEGDVTVQLCRMWEILSDEDCQLVMMTIGYRRRLLHVAQQ